MRNPAIHAIGVPSAESSAGMVAHRERVAAEEKVASTRRHDIGDRVEAREHGGADYRSATVLTATFGHYGWVYRVKFRDGHERKVVAANVRKRGKANG